MESSVIKYYLKKKLKLVKIKASTQQAVIYSPFKKKKP
jgi:hypothetical protein